VAVAAGLLLVGRVLVGDVGSPVQLLGALGGLGDPWADPVAPTISLLALLAETLVAYLLIVLALRSLCRLPGTAGRVARRVTLLVTPVVVRRLLDLLVGGALLAQATLATSALPPGHRPAVPALAMATSLSSSGHAAPATGHDPGSPGMGPPQPRQAVTDPVETRPAPRRSSAPLPPWLGGGPSNPLPRSTRDVRPGSTGDLRPGSTGDLRPGSTGPAARGPASKAKPGSRAGAGPGLSGEPGPGPSGEVVAGYTVAVGDTLWDIAAAHLAPGERTVPNVHRYWPQVYRANRRAIGADPDLIHPGTRLDVPPFRPGRR
jgi:hypothetical protein